MWCPVARPQLTAIQFGASIARGTCTHAAASACRREAAAGLQLRVCRKVFCTGHLPLALTPGDQFSSFLVTPSHVCSCSFKQAQIYIFIFLPRFLKYKTCFSSCRFSASAPGQRRASLLRPCLALVPGPAYGWFPSAAVVNDAAINICPRVCVRTYVFSSPWHVTVIL